MRYVSLFVRTIIFSIATLVSLTPLASGSNNKPNFLIFIADDLTFRDIGAYGNPDVSTPHLDAFAKEGLKFERMFSTTSMCAPTRMELYSGLQPVRSGAYPNHSKVYPGSRSLPNFLRPLGYRVALMGKRHEAPHTSFSFDYLGGQHGDTNRKKIDLDLSLAEKFFAKTKQPWALVVATNQPHTPWFRGDKNAYPPNKLTVPEYLIDTKETRAAMSAYYAEITYMDQQFGRVMSMLDASGNAKNTLVVFLSEQGSNFPFAKWTLYDNGHRAAALMRWPAKIKANTQTVAISHYADILPTLIDAAGGNLAKTQLDGRSLLNVLTEPNSKHRDYAFGLHTTNGIAQGSESYPIRSVRDQQYRLIWNLDYQNTFSNTVVSRGGPGKSFESWLKKSGDGKRRAEFYVQRPEFEFYDLDSDPYELNNLAGTKAIEKEQARLFTALKTWMAQQGDEGIRTEANARHRADRSGKHYPLGIPAGGRDLDWKYD